MKKQVFLNGSAKETIKKSQKEMFAEKLERTTSVLDFYRHKTKILELLRETRE